MLAPSLRGKKIKLSCTLKSKQGEVLGEYASVLVVGTNLSIKLAKQLLDGHSATLVEEGQLKPPPDLREWPEPVKFGPFEWKGKANARTVSVHIPINFEHAGGAASWLILRAAPATFCKLSDDWDQTLSERRLGMLLIKAIHAGSGYSSAFQKSPSPSGINVEEYKVGKIQRGRSITVTIHIAQHAEPQFIRLLAERDVFQRLASLHGGDELSDTRFGHLLRHALWGARNHISRLQVRNDKKRGKLFQRIAYKTAAWLGPALLNNMKPHFENNTGSAQKVRASMTLEVPQLKATLRNMVAFLVDKNWKNWTARFYDIRRKNRSARERDLETIKKWSKKFTPIMRQGRNALYGSGKFWDEIYDRQLKWKRFPWVRLRKTNPKRFEQLTAPAIEERKVLYAQSNPGFDWRKCKEEHPDQYDLLTAQFLADHMSFYQFVLNTRYSKNIARRIPWSEAERSELRTDPRSGEVFLPVPTSGETFLLPKSLEDTVDDILLNRDVFILYP